MPLASPRLRLVVVQVGANERFPMPIPCLMVICEGIALGSAMATAILSSATFSGISPMTPASEIAFFSDIPVAVMLGALQAQSDKSASNPDIHPLLSLIIQLLHPDTLH